MQTEFRLETPQSKNEPCSASDRKSEVGAAALGCATVSIRENSQEDRVTIPRIEANFERRVYCLFGLVFDAISIDEAVGVVTEAIVQRKRCHLVTPNMNFLRLSHSDPSFRDAVLAGDLSALDGMPLVWMARALRIGKAQRVSGADMFVALNDRSVRPIRAFFFGADEATARMLRDRLGERRQGLFCVGAYAPGFGAVEEMSSHTALCAVNRRRPDLLSVSIGARKGLTWLCRNERGLTSPVVCNLGVTIHFAAGTVRRAPPWMRRWGLEWLWRMIAEPRLCGRYATDLLALARAAAFGVAPCLAIRALFPPNAKDVAQAKLTEARFDGTTVLRLKGAWCEDNLGPLRAALTRVASKPSNLAINVAHVTHVDPAFLGLLMIAYGYQKRTGRRFELYGASLWLRAILHINGCRFLLSDRDRAAAHRARGPAPLAAKLNGKLRRLTGVSSLFAMLAKMAGPSHQSQGYGRPSSAN